MTGARTASYWENMAGVSSAYARTPAAPRCARRRRERGRAYAERTGVLGECNAILRQQSFWLLSHKHILCEWIEEPQIGSGGKPLLSRNRLCRGKSPSRRQYGN